MKRSILPVILSFASLLILITTSFAGVPPAMSYQGRLLDSGGDPVADGEHPIRFGLSTEPDNALFWVGEEMSVSNAYLLTAHIDNIIWIDAFEVNI